MIPMSDGVNIAATVYQPAEKKPAGGWPAVIMIHGWGGDRSTYTTVAPVFAEGGYVVLTYDCRGFGSSEGKTSLAGPREIQDLQELLQYLADHFEVDKDNMGVTGISYGGGQSFLLAASTQSPGYTGPKVKAIAPIMGWTDLNEALFPNDIMKSSYDLGLFASGFKPDKQNYGTDLPVWLAEGLTGINQADFKQQLALRSVIGQAEKLKAIPIYALQAWKDELFPVEQVRKLFDLLQDRNRNLKLYAGGFGHPAAVIDGNETNFVFSQVLAWFDYWLKGKQNGIMKEDQRVLIGTEYWPSGQVYPLSPTNRHTALPGHIRSFDSWPATEKSDRYFDRGTLQDRQASTSPEVMANNPVTGIQDDPILGGAIPLVKMPMGSADSLTGAGALRFVTDPLTRDTELLGSVSLRLWLASSNPDAMITARLYDVDPAGERTLVTRGGTRSSGLGITVPGLANFDLFQAHHIFSRGHRMEVELSPSDTPFFLPDKETYLIRLYHERSYPSSIRFSIYAQP
jgi:predicted acyl esterase